jgi:hypothetical protein
MPLERQYTSWDALRSATGTPASRKRAAWREHLRTRPAIVYWGDSWFRTPLYRNLSWHSFIRIDGIALKLGAPGLLAEKMLTPANCRDTATRIASREFDLLAISVGGNDALDKRLDSIFRNHTGSRLEAPEAFARVLASGLFDRLRERYAILMDAMQQHAPHVPVVAHGYARLVRIGEKGRTDIRNLGLARPLIGNVGPWLWRPMKHVLGTHDEARRFADLLLVAGFRELVLKQTAEAYGTFSYADFTGIESTREAGFWYDEIHPTEAGFGVLAEAFNGKVREVLPTGKAGAAG